MLLLILYWPVAERVVDSGTFLFQCMGHGCVPTALPMWVFSPSHWHPGRAVCGKLNLQNDIPDLNTVISLVKCRLF